MMAGSNPDRSEKFFVNFLPINRGQCRMAAGVWCFFVSGAYLGREPLQPLTKLKENTGGGMMTCCDAPVKPDQEAGPSDLKIISVSHNLYNYYRKTFPLWPFSYVLLLLLLLLLHITSSLKQNNHLFEPCSFKGEKDKLLFGSYSLALPLFLLDRRGHSANTYSLC